MGSPPFLLLHSPLVGPATWEPAAAELRARGRRVVVPTAAPGARPRWRALTEAAASALDGLGEPAVLVAHSGAGPLLAPVAAGAPALVAGLVFVDAGLPRTGGTPPPAAALLDQLRALAVGGLLPPWSSWWGEGVMEALVPDPARRARVEAELPSLPLADLLDALPAPPGWDARPGAYLLFSPEAYADAAEEARRRGWPVEEVPEAGHLHLLVDPAGVADALVRLSAGW